jgi:hypothetical protein
MEAQRSSEILVLTRATRRKIPEYGILHPLYCFQALLLFCKIHYNLCDINRILCKVMYTIYEIAPLDPNLIQLIPVYSIASYFFPILRPQMVLMEYIS